MGSLASNLTTQYETEAYLSWATRTLPGRPCCGDDRCGKRRVTPARGARAADADDAVTGGSDDRARASARFATDIICRKASARQSDRGRSGVARPAAVPAEEAAAAGSLPSPPALSPSLIGPSLGASPSSKQPEESASSPPRLLLRFRRRGHLTRLPVVNRIPAASDQPHQSPPSHDLPRTPSPPTTPSPLLPPSSDQAPSIIHPALYLTTPCDGAFSKTGSSGPV